MIKSKLPEYGLTIFTVMSQLAQKHQSINLGQGFPDFEPAQSLRDLVAQAMNQGHNQYPFMAGVAELRQAIAGKIQTLYGHTYNPDTEVTVTAGATQALMSAILASAGHGDEVIVIEPCFDSYLPAIRLAGATAVGVSMQSPTESNPTFRMDWQAVRDAINSKTRVMILNFPHNPTGAVLHDEDLDILETIVQDTGIVLIADEVYEHIVFDGAAHASLARRPLLADHTFLISSFGKTYHATGWKVGYCCAPASMTTELRKVHQFVVFTVNSPVQYGIAAYMRDPKPYLELPAFYQQKRDHLAKALGKGRFRPLPSSGTFFMLVDYSAVSEMPEAEFCEWLTIEHKVTAIPVSAFYRDPTAPASNHQLMRLCFAKSPATLDTAAQRLNAI